MMRVNSISAVIRSIRNGVLGVLEVSHKDAKPSHPYIALLSAFIRIYQASPQSSAPRSQVR